MNEENLQQVELNDFRENLLEYVAGEHPVALSRRSGTLGWFIPTHEEGDLRASLEQAADSLAQLLKQLP